MNLPYIVKGAIHESLKIEDLKDIIVKDNMMTLVFVEEKDNRRIELKIDLKSIQVGINNLEEYRNRF
jgi:hypothetical protein